MQQTSVDSPIHASSLSDLELLRYAEEFVYGQGLPKNFQIELVRRFADKIVQTRSY
jgi:hypothetical protein